MNPMAAKINTLWPEIVLTGTAFLVMILGLSPARTVRRATYFLSAAALIAATIIAAVAGASNSAMAGSSLATFIKVTTCIVGLVLLMTCAELPDENGEEPPKGWSFGTPFPIFDPANTSRGEFFGFLLLSLVGLMLVAGAEDLIWLFLALELTSLPTYVLVATSRPSLRAPEAGVKYFFLGAFAAAIFLYGFALIYTATGTTYLSQIHTIFAPGMSLLALVGVVLAVIGLCFKIAAFPMHEYVADVYQGAATPISTFLAFVPKAAGFVALILLLDTVGWPLDRSFHGIPTGKVLVGVLYALAVATMFIGNALALRQNSVKRVLAYSSVAHSGYMLVGLVAGLGATGSTFIRNGIAAVLFYLVAYGAMTIGAFAVLAILKRDGEEADTFEDIKGLARRRPLLAAIMAICVLSLTGIPPLVGFWGKMFIFGAAINAGYVVLAVLGVINSAIGAFYYLKIVGSCYMHEPQTSTDAAELPSRSLAALASAVAVIVLSLGAGPLVSACGDATHDLMPSGTTRVIVRPVNPTPAPQAKAPNLKGSAI